MNSQHFQTSDRFISEADASVIIKKKKKGRGKSNTVPVFPSTHAMQTTLRGSQAFDATLQYSPRIGTEVQQAVRATSVG